MVLPGIVVGMNISELSTDIADVDDKGIVFYRWLCDPDADCCKAVSAYPPLFLRNSQRTLEQQAEKWCTDRCQRNRFWHVEEVMWFCAECTFWYHFDCCETEHSERSYKSVEDLLAMPLVKGGPMGFTGTSPLVMLAARVMRRITTGEVQANTSDYGSCFSKVVDPYNEAEQDLVRKMLERASTWINAHIKCPRCLG